MRSGEIVTGRFLVERLAGEGGMGAVYRARDTGTGHPVALKVLLNGAAEYAERFARETKILAELRHPAIVRYVAHGDAGQDFPWLAMEWLEGEDLEVRLSRDVVSIGEALLLARRIARALSMTHARGVVHRDLKPSNLFLVDGEVEKVKLLDYGVARGGGGSLTQVGVMIGTIGYMAPEQTRGDADVGASADVFSLGCVLFRCITGRLPFPGANAMAMLAKILLEDAPRLSTLRADVPTALDDLVAQMLTKDPRQRLRDGAAVSGALSSLEVTRYEAPAAIPHIASAPTRAITAGERRLLSILLVSAATPPDAAARSDVDAKSKQFGVHLHWLSTTAAVGMLTLLGDATDQAAQAARYALAFRHIVPDSRLALAMGRAEISGELPVGEAIDRAVALLRAATEREPHARSIWLDDVTAGLLDARFEVGGGFVALELRGERPRMETTRTLLGKPSPCVGREAELATLSRLVADCARDSIAGAVLVTAPAGIGKSRLRYELLRGLVDSTEHLAILIERGDPMRAGSPFGMVAPMLRRAAGIVDGEPLEVRRRKLATRVARNVTVDTMRVTEFLGELVGVPFEDTDSVQLRAAHCDATLMGDQMRRAWENFIAAECTERPLLIVLEDLHWSDLSSVTLLDGMLRNLRDRPVMVIAFARPEVHDLFPRLWVERGLQEIRLGALTVIAAEDLVRKMLGQDAKSETVKRLIYLAGGNALYLEELIRAVAEGRGDVLPETVLAMVQARIERLDQKPRKVLRAASVFGGVFWRGAVQALLGGEPEDTVNDVLDELVLHEVVAPLGPPRFPDEREYVFRHALVREAAYAMLTDRDRATGHELAAHWLERAGETDAAVLAQHFDRGGDVARAISSYRSAADQALGASDLDLAIARSNRGVECGAKGSVLGALRRIQADAHQGRGERDLAEARAAEAMGLLAEGSAEWCLAAAPLLQGDVARLEVLSALLLTIDVQPGAIPAYVIALSRASYALLIAGRYDLARETSQRMEDLSAGLAAEDGTLSEWRDRLRYFQAVHDGAPRRALESLKSAVKHCESAGNLRRKNFLLVSLGDAYKELGLYREAEAVLRDALTISDRLGLPSAGAFAKVNLGFVLGQRESTLAEASTVEADAIAMLTSQSEPRGAGCACAYLAMIVARLGDLAAAGEYARRAVEMLSVAPPMRAFAFATLARVELLQLRALEARAAAGEAMALLESVGRVEEGESLIRLVFAESLHANGSYGEARRAIESARIRLLERAARIDEPTLRASFLQNVPENAKTLALARRWVDDGVVL